MITLHEKCLDAARAIVGSEVRGPLRSGRIDGIATALLAALTPAEPPPCPVCEARDPHGTHGTQAIHREHDADGFPAPSHPVRDAEFAWLLGVEKAARLVAQVEDQHRRDGGAGVTAAIHDLRVALVKP